MKLIYCKMIRMKNIVCDNSNFYFIVYFNYFVVSANCDQETSDKIAGYYCNKELVELLVFDARMTNKSYGTWEFIDDKTKNLIDKYNATLRFVATMSGLTRWQFIFGETEVEGDK